jgi:hypothetical protein
MNAQLLLSLVSTNWRRRWVVNSRGGRLSCPHSLGKRARFTLIVAEEVFRRTRRVHRSDSPLRA